MKEYNRKKLYLKRALFYGMLLLLLVFTTGSAKKAYEERRMQEDIAEKILRFHVRANSDGEADQALKLRCGMLLEKKWENFCRMLRQPKKAAGLQENTSRKLYILQKKSSGRRAMIIR